MTDLKVKICGIKTKQAALASVKLGADFLGFNFVPSSKRKISPPSAQKIILSLRGVPNASDLSAEALSKVEGRRGNPLSGFPIMVGVFMNQSADDVKKVLAIVKLDMLQFHGNESPEFCQSFNFPYIKAFGVGEQTSVKDLMKQMRVYNAQYFLLDRPTQGKGGTIDLKKVKLLAQKFPIMLAGGLTPENVALMVQKAGKINDVDVAGGVETKGKKDSLKIIKFLKNAKS